MTLLNAKVQTSRATAVAGVGMVVRGVRCVCARSSRARGFARSRSWRLADCSCVYWLSQVATRDAAVDVQGELIAHLTLESDFDACGNSGGGVGAARPAAAP